MLSDIAMIGFDPCSQTNLVQTTVLILDEPEG